MMGQRFLLFKDGDEGCKYKVSLCLTGAAVFHCPVLGFESDPHGVSNLCKLAHEDVWAVILTSQRAAEAVADAVAQDETMLTKLTQKRWFVVGKATGRRLQELGITTEGEESGEAAALARVIVEAAKDKVGKKCLFVCGNIRRDTIPSALSAEGVDFEEICVYRTVELTNVAVPEEFYDGSCTSEDEVRRFCVFFSPSGVRSVLASSIQFPLNTTMMAIGKTTANFMEQAGFLDVLVAPEPSPQGILAALGK